MNSLLERTTKLGQKIPYWSCLNPTISQAAVGWHIEHTLLTTDVVVNAIVHSNPDQYKAKFSVAKLVVFTFKTIPRGRIQSPSSVTPKEAFTEATLQEHLKTTCNSIKKLNDLSTDHYFQHPYFGHLNLPSAIKFLNIHSAHHLHIIDDIVKSLQG